MLKFTLSSLILLGAISAQATDALRVNKIGYLADDVKAAVFIGDTDPASLSFVIQGDGVAIAPDSVAIVAPWEPFAHSARIYFSSLEKKGDYTISAIDAEGNVVESADVYIGNDAYSRYKMHEMPLRYMREQRCGSNPAFGQTCHQRDGYLVLSGDRDGEFMDVTGGWHDASDFLQYLPTSANATYQMLFAYQQNPEAWGDEYDAAGHPGANGIPDILDEARHGLEWLLRMNPEPGLYLNQIADDRDHRFAGLPAFDNVDYGWGEGNGRPVYPCSGKPYGLFDNKNESKGLASSVAKFASAFSLGSQAFSEIDPAFAAVLSARADAAYDVAKANPGACQTAPCVSPYYYEEDNYVDDMELAAITLYKASQNADLLKDAVAYGRMEPVTPWMGADSARHYQWYPFVNLGHPQLVAESDGKLRKEFLRNMRAGLARVDERGDNAFRCGIPFIWCSNNLAVAYVTQGLLYEKLSGDKAFVEPVTAVRDWLFGCNPWGQVMMLLPEDMAHISSPADPHSTIIDKHVNGQPGRHWLSGSLVDGPVYATIFNTLRGVHLRNADRFAPFQNTHVVYHDDYSDYSTNEPTMDGTASLTYILSILCNP